MIDEEIEMAHLTCTTHGKRVHVSDGVAIHRSGTSAKEVACNTPTVQISGNVVDVLSNQFNTDTK